MRWSIGSAGALVLSAVALFCATRYVPWLGPSVADGLRAVFGPGPVAKLEAWAYDLDDRYQQLARGGDAPRTYWAEPEHEPEPEPPADRGPERPRPAAFRPADPGPMALRAPGDGRWIAVDDPERPGESPPVFKTMVHPDASRPWTELFVVAVDLSRVSLNLMAGAVDPEALAPEGKRYERPALIPTTEQPDLVLAFNGGFKAEHGRYGMRVDGVTLVAPRDDACTVAAYADGSVRIGPWKDLATTQTGMRFLRQTPPCMYARGERHVALVKTETTKWGAAVGGDAVIRRSAIGLSANRSILFVGIGNATTAPAMADGMHHLGASDVAQLDVNWSYPKILVFRRGADSELEARSLFPGFVFEKDEYIRERAAKDFFYVLRRPTRS